jgi:hypothetical protein
MTYSVGQTVYVLRCEPPHTIRKATIDHVYVNPHGGWPLSYVHAKWRGWGAIFYMSGRSESYGYQLFPTRWQARREKQKRGWA